MKTKPDRSQKLKKQKAERFNVNKTEKHRESGDPQYLILSESDGWGMWAQADSCMACWYSWSLDKGTGPRGQTPNEGGMLTSDKEGWRAAGGADEVVEPGKISIKNREGRYDRAVKNNFIHSNSLQYHTNMMSNSQYHSKQPIAFSYLCL